MTYTVVDNKICTPEGCEINVVHHCNLSCRACSHLSPIMHKKGVEATTLFHDLSILAKYYRPRFIKLLGGEPLLHPHLLDVIDAVKSSGICDYILVCTNGLLLSRMTSQFWERVNEVEISVYPGREPSSEQLLVLRQRAQTHRVRLKLCYYKHFRESYTEWGTRDLQLVRRIYKTCQIAHVWRCQTVFNGYFFKCPQSIFIPQVVHGLSDTIYANGLKIVDSPDFRDLLFAYLISQVPLPSCSNCLGSAGKMFSHEQQSRRNWRTPQQHVTEDLLDNEHLLDLEKNPLKSDNCVYKDLLENEPGLDVEEEKIR